MNKQPLSIKEALEEELKSRMATAISVKMESLDESHGVFRKGGSVGDVNTGKPIKVHDNVEDAKKHAARLNAALSPGEKNYYKIKYHVKPFNEEFAVYEEAELSEISKNTLKSYHRKATDQLDKDFQDARKGLPGIPYRKVVNRVDGIEKVYQKLKKEETELSESKLGQMKDGYYVANMGTSKITHDQPFTDSRYAITHANKGEDKTGYVHRVTKVKNGKVDKQWEYNGGHMEGGWEHFSDFKGDDAKQHFRDIPSHFIHAKE